MAFSSDQQRVLYRQPPNARIDFGALGEAVRGIPAGTVDVSQMLDKASGAKFIAAFLAQELGVEQPAPDAVIVISPTVRVREKAELEEATGPRPPVYFLNYNPNPVGNPWRGALGSALKEAYRSVQFTVTRPGDLGSALRRMKRNLSEAGGSAGSSA